MKKSLKSLHTAARHAAQGLGGTPPATGSPAPDFRGESTQGPIEAAPMLAAGPVVLAFYYADFTPG